MSGGVKTLLLGAALVGAAFVPGLFGFAWSAIGPISLKTAFLLAGSALAQRGLQSLSQVRQRGHILQGVADTQAPLPVVYGRTKLGIRYVDRRTTGAQNRDFFVVGALCHGSEDGSGIAGIDEIFVDDRLAVDAAGNVQDPFKGFLTVTKYAGTDAQTTDPELAANFAGAWPSTSRGLGVAYIMVRMLYDPEVWATGEPQISAIVRGCKVRDPANLGAAPVYSDNPAWCLHDYLRSTRYGLGATAAEVDADSFATAGAYCAAVIAKNDTLGTTGARFTCNGVLDVSQSVKDNLAQLTTACRGIIIFQGGKYRLFIRQPVAPTTFTLNESNIVGDWSFSIPSIGEAPNTVNGIYIEPGRGPKITTIGSSEPTSVTTIEAHGFSSGQRVYIYLDGPTAGTQVPPVLGQYTITVTAPTTFTLNDTGASSGVYVSGSCRVAAENFPHQPATRIWPRPGTANGYLEADSNYEAVSEIALPFTTDPYTAEQLILVGLKEARAGTSVSVTATEAALALVVGDLVPLTHPTPGWSGKQFWVMGVFLIPSSNLVRLSLLEYDAGAYNLDPLSTVPMPPSTNLPNPFFVLPPVNLRLEAGDDQLRPDADGKRLVYIRASWDAAPTDPYLDYYEVQWRMSGINAPWLPVPDGGRADTVAEIGPATEGQAYDVRVRAVNTLGIGSEWVSDDVIPRITVFPTSSAWVDDFTLSTPGRRWVQLAGTGTFRNVLDPDARVGGSVGRLTGPGWWEYADAIPFDPTQLYVLRISVRQLRNPTAGDKAIYIGLAGLQKHPTIEDTWTYINMDGQNLAGNQFMILADGLTLGASREWTDLYAWVKGVGGGVVALTTEMLSSTGLASFSAPNLIDGDTTPSKVAFDPNGSAGAYVLVDLGTPLTITEARLHMAGTDSDAEWELEFADDLGGPWTAST